MNGSDAIKEKAVLLAYNASGPEIEMMARGTSLEFAVGRALALGDKKLLAVYLEKLLRALPEREAAGRARVAMLGSPTAVMLLDSVVRLMLHQAAKPDELREAAQRIEEIFGRLK